jgi:hypothetical protein
VAFAWVWVGMALSADWVRPLALVRTMTLSIGEVKMQEVW